MAYDNRPLLVESNRAGILCRAEQLDLAKSVLGMAYVIGQSAVAVNLTGTLALTTLASVTLPGGLLGANGSIVIEALWSRVASAQAITTTIWGQSTGIILPAGTVVSGRQAQWFWNRGTEAQQLTHHPALVAGTAGSATALVVAAINTAIDQVIPIQAQLLNVGDSVTLEAWRVTAYPT